KRRHEKGRYASIVVVAEGAKPKAGTMVLTSGEVDAFGHVRLGGIGQVLAEEIERRTGFETRVTVLGHVQRGGTPTAFDRVLATRFGAEAMEAVHDGAFGTMVALQAGRIIRVPLGDAVTELKTVAPELLAVAVGAVVVVVAAEAAATVDVVVGAAVVVVVVDEVVVVAGAPMVTVRALGSWPKSLL